MLEGEKEREATVSAIDMAHLHPSRLEAMRQADAKAAERDEIMVAAEMQRALLDRHTKRDADAAADIFLESGRAGEALDAVDRLWEAMTATSVDAHPELAAARRILGDRNRRRHENVAAERQGRADRAEQPGEQAAATAQPAFHDLARIDDRAPLSDMATEARAHRLGQLRPGFLADEGAEAEVAGIRGECSGRDASAEGDDLRLGFVRHCRLRRFCRFRQERNARSKNYPSLRP